MTTSSNSMEFVIKSKGAESRLAFRSSEASSYKCDFINIQLPENSDPYDFAATLINSKDMRISDTEGPAGCIDITDTTYGLLEETLGNDRVYLFFGWMHC